MRARLELKGSPGSSLDSKFEIENFPNERRGLLEPFSERPGSPVKLLSLKHVFENSIICYRTRTASDSPGGLGIFLRGTEYKT
jgi:hypothetical protein